MARNEKPQLEGEFKHNTSIGPNGVILFDCPVEIRDQADLDNYGITKEDCCTLNFHGSDKVRVYMLKVESRAVAEYQWSYLDSQHSRGFASVRCMIPGTRKAFIRCPDTNSCAKCPYKNVKQSPIISWDKQIESGYEPVAGPSAEEQIMAKLEYEDIKALMDAEDERIAQAFEMKELLGMKADEIAKKLDISSPRVYQLVARAKAIGKAYKEARDND